ncbi:unnamed protein product [Urochloa decumbens]|uniref:Ribosome-recycling factor, chloroplastic n=1 Tax=Urochloa decumbens TaxID=240449 RepID=A0ABC9BB69_9POAL
MTMTLSTRPVPLAAWLGHCSFLPLPHQQRAWRSTPSPPRRSPPRCAPSRAASHSAQAVAVSQSNRPPFTQTLQDFRLGQWTLLAGLWLFDTWTRVLTHATIEEIEAEKSVIEEQAKEKMEKAIETVQTNFNTVRTGRANPAMLDRIEVEYYGTPVNLKSIAQISTPDATSLLIQPYDKSSLKLIEKTIVAANLGVTPSNDGEVIRVTVPPLTSDRRKELAKTVAKLAEDGKVAIRNIRRDAIKAYDKLQKEKKLSEDNVKDLSADLQKVTDGYMKKIESIQKQKEEELMKI